jgi:hemerythrin-like metal-binding protein
MTALAWSEALALKQPRMDQTHREFVALLQDLGDAHAAGETTFDTRLQHLRAHTEAHFAQEERWMADIGFAPQNCHAMQHAQVLKVLAEVQRAMAAGGDREVIAVLVDELGRWFVAHAQMMDAALAEMMVARGYDPETGCLLDPAPADAPAITGCGSRSCG